MALILRNCILNQRKQLVKECILFRYSINGHASNSDNIKNCGSIVYVRHFSVENDENLDKKVIYKGSLTNQIRRLKIFSLATSVGSLLMQPLIYMKAVEDDNIANVGMVFAFISLGATLSPLLIHLLTKRYVTDMYYLPKENMYIAEVFNIFFKKKQIIFTKNDVHVPEVGGMLTSCNVNGSPLLFSESEFSDPKHYYIIMRYNDPIDFEMDNNVTNTQRISINSMRKVLENTERTQKQIESKQQKEN